MRSFENTSSNVGRVDMLTMQNTSSSGAEPKPRKLTKKQRQSLAINMIIEACKLLDWSISVPKRGKVVRYLVIGELRAVRRLLKREKK